MHEEARVLDAAGRLLEHADEELADRLALLLRVDDALQALEETIGHAHVDELDALMPAKRLDDLLAFVLAHEARVDEHARELMTDGLVHERGRDCGVDAARQPADDALAADLRANRVDGRLDDGAHRPRRHAAAGVVEEVLQHLLAVRRVHDLGMELHTEQPPLDRLERGRRRVGRRRRDREAVRRA